jgi:hypothetical protein
VWLLCMQGAYGERRLQPAPRRNHSTEEVRTTKHDQYSGKRMIHSSLRWGKRQHQGKAKSGKQLPRSGLVQLCIRRHPAAKHPVTRTNTASGSRARLLPMVRRYPAVEHNRCRLCTVRGCLSLDQSILDGRRLSSTPPHRLLTAPGRLCDLAARQRDAVKPRLAGELDGHAPSSTTWERVFRRAAVKHRLSVICGRPSPSSTVLRVSFTASGRLAPA